MYDEVIIEHSHDRAFTTYQEQLQLACCFSSNGDADRTTYIMYEL
jgi:hypothetical protein